MDVIASEAKQSLLFESKRLPRPFGPRNDNSSNYMRQSTICFFTPLIRHDQRKIPFSNPILKPAVKSATTFYLYNSPLAFPDASQTRKTILPLKSAYGKQHLITILFTLHEIRASRIEHQESSIEIRFVAYPERSRRASRDTH